MKFVRVLLILLVALPVVAQQRAVREDGIAVILHPDGRWEIVPTVDSRVYFGNLHSHTSYSDGSGTPTEAYRHARDVARLDFLAITEHNHHGAPSQVATNHDLYNGPQASSLIQTARRFDEPGRFVALYGQEFSSIGSGNHANVLEIGEVIDETVVPNGRWNLLFDTWLPAHKDSQNQPAIMLLNHPSQSSSPNSKEYGIDDYPNQSTWRERLEGHVRLINLINGPSHDDTSPGAPSEAEYRRCLDLGLHVSPTADQDNHRTNWGSAARTRTGVWASGLSKHAILTALRERHTYATEDENLRLLGTVNGQLMGTHFTNVLPDTPLTITLAINDDDEPGATYTVDVYSDTIGGSSQADVVMQVQHSGDGTLTIPGLRYTGGAQYVFLKVTQRDEDEHVDRAWLAPVWFEPNAASVAPGGPTPGVVSVTLEVNRATEEALITNRGDALLNLTGWVLVSTVGDQRYTFPQTFTLAPGASVTVTSGPRAHTGTGFLKWTGEYIWRNDSDPGQLLDQNGALRAESM